MKRGVRFFTVLLVLTGILSLCAAAQVTKASSVGDSYGDYLSPKEDGEQAVVGARFTVQYEAWYRNGSYGSRTHHCSIVVKDSDGTIVLEDDYIYTKGSVVETSFIPEKEGVYTIREQSYFLHPAGGRYVGDDKTITINVVKEPESEAEPTEEESKEDAPTEEAPKEDTPAEEESKEDPAGKDLSGKYTIGQIKYTVKNSAATVVKPKSKSSTKITIPATVKVKGKSVKVTSIASNAFKDMKKLKTVTIGKNIKKIGKNAFYGCKKLEQITIKTTKLSAKVIGQNAFKGVYKKAVVKCPKSKKAAYKKILLEKGLKSTAKFK